MKEIYWLFAVVYTFMVWGWWGFVAILFPIFPLIDLTLYIIHHVAK